MADRGDEEDLPLFKIILVGDAGVGKTAIYRRFKDNTFNPFGSVTTGADHYTKAVEVNNLRFKICLWDTAGMERMGSLTSHFYRDAKAVCFVCGVDDNNTLNTLRNWEEDVKRYEHHAQGFLVVNKMDVDNDEHQVNTRTASAFADAMHMLQVYHVSAKAGEGIDDMFEDIVRNLFGRTSPAVHRGSQVILEAHIGTVKEKPKWCPSC